MSLRYFLDHTLSCIWRSWFSFNFSQSSKNSLLFRHFYDPPGVVPFLGHLPFFIRAILIDTHTYIFTGPRYSFLPFGYAFARVSHQGCASRTWESFWLWCPCFHRFDKYKYSQSFQEGGWCWYSCQSRTCCKADLISKGWGGQGHGGKRAPLGLWRNTTLYTSIIPPENH